ncbi:ribulose-phosphate 3-epimerase [bacterium]|nr:ribulose-phosphate 3-epimerase [bacterium]
MSAGTGPAERPLAFAPSILASDFLRLGELLSECERGGAERIHVDVMDGLFVPNLSMGLPIVEAVRRGTRLPVEVHLMIERPERYLEDFSRAGGDRLIVHQEATDHLHRAVHQVRELERKVSVALNPATPVGTLDHVIEELDSVLVMTVNPGFGGQKFIASMLPKIRRLRAILDERNPACEVEVDGGIDERTAPLAAEAGATALVAGTSVFAATGGPAGGLARLRSCCAGIAHRASR